MRNTMKLLLVVLTVMYCRFGISQQGWVQVTTPVNRGRIDDIFMVNTLLGYAAAGDGQVFKTTDGGHTWTIVNSYADVYYRSIEFVSDTKGFVGGFPRGNSTVNVFQMTEDGGQTWSDISPRIDPAARSGICGLAAPDSNTIYGCGNWYQDSGYIVKSADGGLTWSFIDMHQYATAIIDMHFISKDTGFVTGRGPGPLRTAVILYTTDGGQSWTYKYQNTVRDEYCWKIQRLTEKIYFASIEDLTNVPPSILKSTDGGMTWQQIIIRPKEYYMEGVGFIDSLRGWAGGANDISFETADGGITWKGVKICPLMNRVFRVNDTLLFASGSGIWKFTRDRPVPEPPPPPPPPLFTGLKTYPNPASDFFTVDVTLSMPTRLMLLLFDSRGHRVKTIVNANRDRGQHKFSVPSKSFAGGVYYVLMKTHEDKSMQKVLISH